MDNETLAAIIAVGGGLIGGVITLIGQFVLFQKESTLKKIILNLDRTDKFKLVALEKRLEKHQEAFRLWAELSVLLHDKTGMKNEKIKECNKFWKENCLYLNQESSKAFNDCIYDVSMYDIYLQMNSEAKQEGRDKYYDIDKIFKSIKSVGTIIADGVGLPHLENKEIKTT